MSKLIMLIAIFAIAWWLLKRYLRSMSSGAPPAAAPEDMVRCAQCGVHLPSSESISRNEQRYCSEEHARLRD